MSRTRPEPGGPEPAAEIAGSGGALAPLAPRAPLADEVYERLRAWIIDSVREPGVRLNVDAAARMLDVSPTPVREALVRLEAEGFVVKEPLRGWSVTPPLDTDGLSQLYDLRLLLEPWAAGRAASRCTPPDRERLLAELESCPVAPPGGGFGDYRAIVDHDMRLHDLLLGIAGNREVQAAFARTNCHLHTFRLTYGRAMGDHALEEHRAVVDAVVAGDAKGAERAMRRHLHQSRARLIDRLQEQP